MAYMLLSHDYGCQRRLKVSPVLAVPTKVDVGAFPPPVKPPSRGGFAMASLRTQNPLAQLTKKIYRICVPRALQPPLPAPQQWFDATRTIIARACWDQVFGCGRWGAKKVKVVVCNSEARTVPLAVLTRTPPLDSWCMGS